MNPRRAFSNLPWRNAMLVFAMIAAFVGHVMPQGVMPDIADNHVLRVTICADSALATHEMVLTESGEFVRSDGQDAGDDGDSADGFCPFAAVSIALPHDAAAQFVAHPIRGTAPAVLLASSIFTGAAAPLPPATGPPALA